MAMCRLFPDPGVPVKKLMLIVFLLPDFPIKPRYFIDPAADPHRKAQDLIQQPEIQIIQKIHRYTLLETIQS